MTAGRHTRIWRNLLVALAAILSLSAIGFALLAPPPDPGTWSPATAPERDVQPTPATASVKKGTPVDEPAAVHVPVFKRGVNLSRLMSFARRDPAGDGRYLWPPFKGDLTIMTDAEIGRLGDLGFDFVRFPIDAGPFLAAEETDAKLLLQTMRQWVLRLRKNGLAVLLDIHPANYASNWRPEAILEDPQSKTFAQYDALLKRIAELFKDQPADSFALELMNEPQPVCQREDGEDWTVTQKRLFKTVRAAAPEMPVVLTGGCWSSVDGLLLLDPGSYDAATLYDFHFYEPYYFTHQSLPWASAPARYLAGVSYPAASGSLDKTLAETKAQIARLAANGTTPAADAMARAEKEVRYYYDKQKPGPQLIAARFGAVADWAKAHGVTPDRVVLGEFSAIRWPAEVAEDGSRLRWLKDVRTAAEAHGFGWALWDYTEGFGLLSDNAGRVVDIGTAEALGLETVALGR